jgi:hypothetical protein
LKFDAKPDIAYLRKLFRDLYHAQGCASQPKLWDWDSMDLDFIVSGGTTGAGGENRRIAEPDAILSGGGISGGKMEVGDGYMSNGGGQQAGSSGYPDVSRPNTATAVASRPTTSWGFSARTPAPELPLSGTFPLPPKFTSFPHFILFMNGIIIGNGAPAYQTMNTAGIAAAGDQSRRPHTAGGRSYIKNSYTHHIIIILNLFINFRAGASPAAIDPRTGRPVQEIEEVRQRRLD